MQKKLLYLRGDAPPFNPILQKFEEIHYDCLVVRSVEELLQSLSRRDSEYLLVIDASASKDEISQRLLQITSYPELFVIPTIFMGENIVALSDTAQSRFKSFLPLNTPLNSQQFSQVVAKYFVPQKVPAAVEVSPAKVIARDPTRLGAQYGGAVLREANTIGAFTEDSYLPDSLNKESMRAVVQQITQSKGDLGLHIRRTAFLSKAVANKLSMGAQLQETIQTSGLLLHFAYTETGQLLEFRDLLYSGGAPGDEFYNYLRMTSHLILEQFSDFEAAKVINGIAQMLKDGSVPEGDTHRAASCVLATEITNSACWRGGRYSNYGANKVLSGFRNSKWPLHQESVASLARVIGESVLDSYGTEIPEYIKRLTPAQKVKRRRAQEARVEEQKRFDELYSNQTTVSLLELTPGMKLAHPIYTVDGEMLLNANITMDMDLILRILQLAAVRQVEQEVRIDKVKR